MVTGVYTIMGGLVNALIQPNMQQLISDIWQGILDHILTKPVDAQLMVSIHRSKILPATDILLGLCVLIVGISQTQSKIGFMESLIFTVLLFIGGTMIYCFWLIMTTGAFWVIRMDNILELFQGVYQAGCWPITIYPNWLRGVLTFLVLVAFAVTVPS